MFKTVLGKLHDKAENRTPRKDKEITYSHPSLHTLREGRYEIVKILFTVSGGWQSAQPARSPVLLPTPRWWCPSAPTRSPHCRTSPLRWDVSHLCSQLLIHTGSGNHLHRNQARRTASSAAPEKLRWWLLLAGGCSSNTWSNSIFSFCPLTLFPSPFC